MICALSSLKFEGMPLIFLLHQDAKQQCTEAVEAARKEERRKYEEFITEHEVCL